MSFQGPPPGGSQLNPLEGLALKAMEKIKPRRGSRSSCFLKVYALRAGSVLWLNVKDTPGKPLENTPRAKGEIRPKAGDKFLFFLSFPWPRAQGERKETYHLAFSSSMAFYLHSPAIRRRTLRMALRE